MFPFAPISALPSDISTMVLLNQTIKNQACARSRARRMPYIDPITEITAPACAPISELPSDIRTMVLLNKPNKESDRSRSKRMPYIDPITEITVPVRTNFCVTI